MRDVGCDLNFPICFTSSLLAAKTGVNIIEPHGLASQAIVIIKMAHLLTSISWIILGWKKTSYKTMGHSEHFILKLPT